MRACLAFALMVLALTACSRGGEVEQAARDRSNARVAWKLVLDHGGSTYEIPIERMDIYLTEDEYPEIFEIRGDGVTLVGELPAGVRVDYDEAFERLIDREVTIQANGGDPRQPKTSTVTIDGIVTPVSTGSFTVKQLTGKWGSSDGDRTLHGDIELRLPGLDGERTLRGRFAAHAVTWG